MVVWYKTYTKTNTLWERLRIKITFEGQTKYWWDCIVHNEREIPIIYNTLRPYRL